MGDCSADFSSSGASDSYDLPNLTDKCPFKEDVDYLLLGVGESAGAENGIEVKVAGIFTPSNPDESEFPVTCVDFYFEGEPLNPKPICFQDTVAVQSGNIVCPNSFSDYGITLKHWKVEDEKLPVVIESNTPHLNSLADLFNECLNQGKEIYGCLRYVPHTKLSHEDKITDGTYQAFYSPDSQMGETYAAQWPACSEKVESVLDPDNQYQKALSFRYVVEKMVMGSPEIAHTGTAIDEGAIFMFASSIDDLGIRQNMDQTSNLSPSTCYTSLMIHEATHVKWPGSILWHPLEEAAARHTEFKSVSNYDYAPVLDVIAELDQKITFGYKEDDQTKHITITPVNILPDAVNLVVLEINTGNSLFTFSEHMGTANVFSGALPLDYQVVIDYNGLSANGKQSIRLRIYNLYLNGALSREFICNENSYQVKLGLTIDGNFYLCPQAIQPYEEGEVEYQPLDGSGDVSFIYSTGYCFFEGIGSQYGVEGADFSSFFTELTAAVNGFNAMPLIDQYNKKFCTLDAIQEIMDEDLGTGKFDVKEYAKAFGYHKEKPWCRRLSVYSGISNNFGSSMLPKFDRNLMPQIMQPFYESVLVRQPH